MSQQKSIPDGYEFIGTFGFSAGEELLSKLDQVTDPKERNAITQQFIAENRHKFFTSDELEAIRSTTADPDEEGMP